MGLRSAVSCFLVLLLHGSMLKGEEPGGGETYPIAVLEAPGWEHPGSSSPEVLVRALRAAGFQVATVSPDELEAPERFHVGRFSMVVLPYGEYFPARARANFLRFLEAGGDFISMGGYAFRRPVVKRAGRWVPVGEYLRYRRTRFLDIGSEGDEVYLSGDWYDAERASEGATFRWTGRSASVQLVPPVEGPWRVVVEGAIREEVRGLRREVWWKERLVGALSGKSLHRWELSMPPVPAGEQPGGELRLECDTWIPAELLGTKDHRALGVAVGTIKVVAAGETEPATPDAREDLLRPINTAEGRARDFLEVEAEQIGVFDAGYPLEQAAVARTATDQLVLRRQVEVPGPFFGYAATGMVGARWHAGDAGDEGRLVPLVRTFDLYGRFRGNLGSLILNYADGYRGSLWAFFGMENGDLFAPDARGMLDGLGDIAAFFARGLFLHGSRPELACYYPEEEGRILTAVSNVSNVTRTIRVEFAIWGGPREPVGWESQRLIAAPHSVTAATSTFRVPKEGPGYSPVRVSLYLGGRKMDEEYTGLLVWRPEQFRSTGFPLSWAGRRLGAAGAPFFLLGTQAFYPRASAADRSPPMVWSDFQRMRDYGVHLARTFAWSKEKAHTRFEQAAVVAGQRFGIVNFVEGLAEGPAVDTAGLVEAASRARAAAVRYREVPGLLFDVRNEPAFRETHLAQLVPAFRESVGAATGETVKDIPLQGEWGNLRVVQGHRFLTSVMRDWLAACAEGVHEASPGRLVTVGHLKYLRHQPVDRRASIDHLDFANQHFYADIERLRQLSAELLLLDMGYAGRPVSLGEFGSKTHPAFARTGHNYDSGEEQLRRYAQAVHETFGLGGLFACNWHWRDPLSCVFPYGLFHQDGVPKKAAKLYRAMSLLLAGVRPAAATPEAYVLIPESHRAGAGWAPVTEATLACIARLLDCQTPIGVIHEADLPRLPKEVRVLFWPVPYCPPDEVYLRVAEFVRAGGALYLSGDVSYDEETRRRTRTPRLIELCGVEFVAERYPDIRFREAPPVRVIAGTAEIGLAGGMAYPALEVRPAGGVPLLLSEAGEPVVVLNRLGNGWVLYNVEPVELEWEVGARPAPGVSDLYRWFLRRSGLAGLPVEPKVEDFRAMRVPTADRGDVYVFIDLAEDRSTQTARLKGVREEYTLALRDHLPGLVRLDRQGRVIAVEAGSEFRAGETLVAAGDAPFMVMALDGADIRESRMLAMVPFARGRFSMLTRADWEQPALEVGEVKDGVWRSLDSVFLRPDTEGMLRFQVHGLQEMEIMIICERGKEAACRAAVTRRLTRPWGTD